MIRQPYNPLFLRLWDVYPKGRAVKREAETAFLALRREKFEDDNKDTEELVDALKWQLQEYRDEHPDDAKYRYFPHLNRWLSKGYWEKEKPRKFDDCVCGKPNDGTHKYNMINGRKVYKCNACRGAGGNIRIGER